MQQKRFTKKRILGIVFIILGGALGITAFPVFWPLVHLEDMMYLNNGITNVILGAIIFYLLFLALATPMLRAMHRLEKALTKQSPSFILFGSVFSLIGLLLANVVSIPLYRMPIFALNTVVPILLMIALGYLGFRIGTTRMEEWRRLIQPKKRNADVLERKVGDNFRKYKILDTSVIIDGRIKEIAKTGFIEGTLMVPNFVLHELQLISDSADNLKRARGRRGLDILNDIQKDDSLSVEMYDGDFEDLTEVDSKLVKLAKLLDGIVVTNDYNLNKVCEFQNVPVFNINQLANTLKPAVLPGEAMTVTVVKAGTERQQGVAYLDDGTMIVVEDGQHYLNKPLEVIVTSALQTAAGRMIFARPAHQQKGLKEK
ncbi:PIN/TRAM domain-containing protein [Latilactobacillus curvatus]|uniref:PIN/TRAM domain-containing protein n=1 Tax=Latilactobacillus curvatus TaxID=28038 RepID=UPI0020C772D2|nr:PIN/TRAM domain-containing protein [Latilactobacillus curvatus]MCP8861508.1 PIN/TRAM domain-containing protein [Latilactobacillus curvatus]MCP8867696.1 PIN/TRAM domain-containing protein [Latilactobacillus curvatus]MCP8871220.1 PIN/TRAM domain-containing protein [Latilactobacillus curvatus]MCP8880265.1 PIN/TRAM domain-containing protein [Latilactobacillus curvatus]